MLPVRITSALIPVRCWEYKCDHQFCTPFSDHSKQEIEDWNDYLDLMEWRRNHDFSQYDFSGFDREKWDRDNIYIGRPVNGCFSLSTSRRPLNTEKLVVYEFPNYTRFGVYDDDDNEVEFYAPPGYPYEWVVEYFSKMAYYDHHQFIGMMGQLFTWDYRVYEK